MLTEPAEGPFRSWRRRNGEPRRRRPRGRRPDGGAVAAAERHHLALTDARPRALSEIITPNDFVVTVCDNAHEELGVSGNLHWSIPDPVRIGTAAAFDTTYAELQRRISDLAPRLAAS